MSYQIASLFHMYIDMGKRIAGKQDRFSLIIEEPPQGPQNTPKNIHFFNILAHKWKNGFQIFFFFHIFYFYSKGSYQIASIFDM